MKICIVGPITTVTYFGGVATFDEGIAEGFLANGCEVLLATDQKNAAAMTSGNVPVRHIDRRSLAKLIEREKPQYVLTGLAYARYLPKKNNSKIKYIYYLHGFFIAKAYGQLKAVLATLYQRYLLKRCDYVFANSYLTQMINDHICSIHTDFVAHVGVTPTFYHAAMSHSYVEKEAGSILFCGRLNKIKGSQAVMEAAEELNRRGEKYKLYIIGEGSEKKKMMDFAQQKNLSVEFLGFVPSPEIVQHYLRAEVFISLNISEPCGIVFQEALLCGCKIVCPYTGGQVEYLLPYRDSVSFVGVGCSASLADGIAEAISRKSLPHLLPEEIETFTYEYTAKKIIAFLKSKELES